MLGELFSVDWKEEEQEEEEDERARERERRELVLVLVLVVVVRSPRGERREPIALVFLFLSSPS